MKTKENIKFMPLERKECDSSNNLRPIYRWFC